MLRLSNAILLVSSTLIAWMLLRQVIMAYALGDERGKEEVMEKPPIITSYSHRQSSLGRTWEACQKEQR